MAIVSFNVPEDIKQAFHEAFADEGEDAVIARLMQQAVKERELRRAAAMDALLVLRRKQRPVSDAEIAKARTTGRP
jgi:hypothetical protein